MYKYFKPRIFNGEKFMLFFSRELSLEEKNVYMEALAFVLDIGHSKTEAKKDYMEAQMAEIGLSKKDFRGAKKVKTAEDLAKDIKGTGDIKVKRFILREMILLALADHELTDEEIQTIYQIGTCSGLKEEKISDFFLWAAKGIEWQIEGTQLVEDNL